MKTFKVGIVALLLAVLALLAINIWTSAQSNNVIQACVSRDGTIRIVTAAGACKDKETPLQWNTQSPAASRGVQGFYTVVETITVSGDSVGNGTTVRCSLGDKVTGGGYNVEATTGGNLAFANFGAVQDSPVPADTANNQGEGWAVRVWSSIGPTQFALKVYAICADLTR